MTGTVHSITRDAESTRLVAAAGRIRELDDQGAHGDLADLLDAISAAIKARRDPPMTEAEMWRWGGVVAADERLIEMVRRGFTPVDPLGQHLAAWRRSVTQDATETRPRLAAVASGPAPQGAGTPLKAQSESGLKDLAAGPVPTTRPGGDTTHQDTTMRTAPALVPQPLGDPTVPGLLRALANHLDAHPDLPAPVSVSSLTDDDAWHPHIQLSDSTRDAFNRWAESVGGHARIERGVARAHGHIAGRPVDLFDAGDWTKR